MLTRLSKIFATL